MLICSSVVEAKEIVQEEAPALFRLLRSGRVSDATSATTAVPLVGAMAPEEVKVEISNVGGPISHAGALIAGPLFTFVPIVYMVLQVESTEVAGVLAPEAVFRRLQAAEPNRRWKRLLHRLT